jgi:hypothetical protein
MICNRLTLLILLFSLPLLVGCNKESFGNETQEERILGTWVFSKVKFKQNADSYYHDISNGFENCSMTFDADGTLHAYDAKLDTTAIGWWYIDFYIKYDEDDDSETTIYVLIGQLDIPELGIYEEIYWDDLNIRRSKLKGNEHKAEGKYQYTLIR